MEIKWLISLVFLSQAIINIGVNLVVGQKPSPTQQSFKCSNNGNFKSDALLKERDDAFALLYKSMGSQRRYNGYDTGNADGIWTMALCPPNIKKEACLECINNTIPYLKKNCAKQKEGVAWTALPKLTCMVRYADFRIQGRLAEWAWTSFSSPPNQTPASAADLEKGLNALANKLKETAAGGDIIMKFASGALAYGPGSRALYPLYGYMQCTVDIEKGNCMKCLSDATKAIHNCCSKGRKLSGIALSTNCYFWYAHADFSPKKLVAVSSASTLHLRKIQNP